MNTPYQRLHNQHISSGRFGRAEDVVRWMGAMQAQDYGQAVWGIGARMNGGTLADVERAIAEGRILRTWPMRGTMHFVAAEDAKWMLQLSAARMIALDGRRLAQLGLDDGVIERCKELFEGALQGGKRLSRPEMMGLLEENGISTKGGRGYHALWHAAQVGLICVGPMIGKQQSFALLNEWAPGARELSRDEALAELAGRYFASRGPATVQDFLWWSGLMARDGRAGFEMARGHLVSETVEGVEYWMKEGAAGDGTGAYLLAGFDEYLLGYKDRSAVLAAEYAPKIIPGGNGVFQPVMVRDGQVVGTWKRVVKKTGVVVTLVPFGEVEVGTFDEAVRRYERFAGRVIVD